MKYYYDRFVSWCRKATLEESWSILIIMVFFFAIAANNWLAATGWFTAYVYVKKHEPHRLEMLRKEKETDITPD